MTCRDVVEFLSEFVSDELPADVQVDFSGHVSDCPACLHFLNQYRDTIAASKASFRLPDDVPDELIAAILKSIDRDR